MNFEQLVEAKALLEAPFDGAQAIREWAERRSRECDEIHIAMMEAVIRGDWQPGLQPWLDWNERRSA